VQRRELTSRGSISLGVRTAMRVFALTAVFAAFYLSPSAFSQEKLSEAVQGTDAPADAPALSLAERTVLSTANAEIARRVNARSRPVSPGATVEAVALMRSPSGNYGLVFRYRIDWIEWSQSELLPDSEEDLSANAMQAVAAVDLSPLEVTIMDRGEAQRLLKNCSVFLQPMVRSLSPPFFRRLTNVRWDPRVAAPILESTTRIPNTENQCVRADLNLVSGEMSCRDIACAVE